MAAVVVEEVETLDRTYPGNVRFAGTGYLCRDDRPFVVD